MKRLVLASLALFMIYHNYDSLAQHAPDGYLRPFKNVYYPYEHVALDLVIRNTTWGRIRILNFMGVESRLIVRDPENNILHYVGNLNCYSKYDVQVPPGDSIHAEHVFHYSDREVIRSKEYFMYNMPPGEYGVSLKIAYTNLDRNLYFLDVVDTMVLQCSFTVLPEREDEMHNTRLLEQSMTDLRDFKGNEARLRAVVNQRPQSIYRAKALFYLGCSYIDHRIYGKAVGVFRRLADQYPDDIFGVKGMDHLMNLYRLKSRKDLGFLTRFGREHPRTRCSRLLSENIDSMKQRMDSHR